MKGTLQADSHAGSDGYDIRSIYFDDLQDSGLEEKEGGMFERAKYRIRLYNRDPSFIRFEKKQKQGRLSSKLSLPLREEQARDVLQGQYAFLAQSGPLGEELYRLFRTQGLHPKVTVDYHRKAYVYPFSRVRITLDSAVSASPAIALTEARLPFMPVLEGGGLVAEVKFDGQLPPALQALFRGLHLQQTAYSKYLLCRQALDPAFTYGNLIPHIGRSL